MTTFRVILQDATQVREYNNAISFVAEDKSGSFGILAGHTRFMTSTVMGLSRFCLDNNDWLYIATPGALLDFNNNCLTLSSRHFLVDSDYTRISEALEKQLLREETELLEQKRNLRQMEEEMLKQLWQAGRSRVV